MLSVLTDESADFRFSSALALFSLIKRTPSTVVAPIKSNNKNEVISRGNGEVGFTQFLHGSSGWTEDEEGVTGVEAILVLFSIHTHLKLFERQSQVGGLEEKRNVSMVTFIKRK